MTAGTAMFATSDSNNMRQHEAAHFYALILLLIAVRSRYLRLAIEVVDMRSFVSVHHLPTDVVANARREPRCAL